MKIMGAEDRGYTCKKNFALLACADARKLRNRAFDTYEQLLINCLLKGK
jgi:hypothetical protein